MVDNSTFLGGGNLTVRLTLLIKIKSPVPWCKKDVLLGRGRNSQLLFYRVLWNMLDAEQIWYKKAKDLLWAWKGKCPTDYKSLLNSKVQWYWEIRESCISCRVCRIQKVG